MKVFPRFLLCLSLLLIGFASLTTSSVNAEARRIAILPIYNNSGHRLNDVEAYLQEELDKNLHIPLNSTLNIAEFIPQDEIMASVATINHHKPNAMFLELVANDLKADMAVCLLIDKAYEYTLPRWNENLLCSGISLKLIVYDNKRLPMSATVSASDSYYDIYSGNGTLLELTKNTAYKLFKKAELKQTIFPIEKN